MYEVRILGCLILPGVMPRRQGEGLNIKRKGGIHEPCADPHAGCCGGRGIKTPGYPIMVFSLKLKIFVDSLAYYKN